MPTLKQLRCEIEWGTTQNPFPEYGTTYGDGVVETYIAIPEHPQSFAVRLRSKNYIAEGLAMLVFMDGDYQCNRNRLNLKLPKPGVPPKTTEINIRVRQREKPLGNGTYLGREWRFDKHNIGELLQPLIDDNATYAHGFLVPLDQLPSNVDRQHFDDLGTICVFVLRCRAKEEVEHRSTTSSEVDDSILRTSEPTSETLTAEPTPSNITNVQKTETEQTETQQIETEPEMLLGFMNDGAADTHQFGLDGEGPGPAEQKAWSWNTAQPPLSAGHGPSGGYVPGQPPPAQNRPYGSYGYPSGMPQPWQPGPALSQDQSTAQRPQRHVHFNDQLPPQPPGYGASGQPYGGPNLNANVGQSQEKGYPQQPSGYPASRQPYGGQNFTTNVAQSQEREGPQQPGNYGHPPQSEFHHQIPPSHGAVPGTYANPPLVHGGMPNPQGHTRGFSLVQDLSYPPPMPGYPPPVPSYQPIGYGVPEYTGWPPAANHPAYAQPAWLGQSMPGPSYLTSHNFAPPYQPSHPYLYPQPVYPGGPVAPMPPPASSHPGGGIWGPPPPNQGSQDPAKDENNQLDGQGNQNPDNTSNAAGQSNDNNTQGWGNGDTNKAQVGDSGWNSNDAGGGQTENWNNTATQTEAPPQDWNPSTTETGQTNNADSSWNNNNNANASTQAQDSWHNNATTSTQVQNSWNTAPETAQPNEATFTLPQQGPAAALLAQGRPLYGPHGPYYDRPHAFEDRELQPDVGEEPAYDVPADVPTTHQVKPGPGFMYAHKRRSPEYLDTLEEPYARFVFKYRTKEQIENVLGIKIEDEPTGDEEKRKLQVMNKDEIIDMLLRAKIALGGKVPSPPSVPETSDEYTRNIAEPTAIPAPAYNFLDYSVPTVRSVKNVPTAGDHVGLGVSIPEQEPAPAAANTTTQDWGGNNGWSSNNAAAAPAPQRQPATNTWVAQPAARAPQQQLATDAWGAQPAAPAPQQQTTTETWGPPAPGRAPSQHQATDSWALPPGPTQSQTHLYPQTQPEPRPQQSQQPQQPQQLQQPQQPQQPAIPPIQFGSNVQNYTPGKAGARPVTPPNGGWNAVQTAQSSNASDNGMAGWGQGSGAGGGGAGDGGAGWVGGSTASAQPSGGW